MSCLFIYTIHFKQNTSWFYYCSPKFQVTFSFTHSHFSWFPCNGFIRENSNPYVTLTFHFTGQCLACSFYLPISDPMLIQCLQSIRTESNSKASFGITFHAAFLHFPVFRSFRL